MKAVILAAFEKGGGDFNAGRRTFHLLREAGCEDVVVRAAVVALQDGHPYMRLPVLFANSLRTKILEGGMMQEDELEVAIARCEDAIRGRDAFVLSFVVT